MVSISFFLFLFPFHCFSSAKGICVWNIDFICTLLSNNTVLLSMRCANDFNIWYMNSYEYIDDTYIRLENIYGCFIWMLCFLLCSIQSCRHLDIIFFFAATEILILNSYMKCHRLQEIHSRFQQLWYIHQCENLIEGSAVEFVSTLIFVSLTLTFCTDINIIFNIYPVCR